MPKALCLACEIVYRPLRAYLICCGYYRDPKDGASIFDTNILGPLRICQVFVPLLKNNTAAGNDVVSRLLLLSSDLSSLKLAKPGNDAPYSMSKVH